MARHDAVEPVIADIVAAKRETANVKKFTGDAEAGGRPDCRIILEHLAKRLRLLVEDQRRIVAADAERQVFGRLVAQHAGAATLAHTSLVLTLSGDDDHIFVSVRFLRKGRERQCG